MMTAEIPYPDQQDTRSIPREPSCWVCPVWVKDFKITLERGISKKGRAGKGRNFGHSVLLVGRNKETLHRHKFSSSEL